MKLLILSLLLISNVCIAKCNTDPNYRLIKFSPTSLVAYLSKDAKVKKEIIDSRWDYIVTYNIQYKGINFRIDDLVPGYYPEYEIDPNWSKQLPNIGESTKLIRLYCNEEHCSYFIPLTSEKIVTTNFPRKITYSIPFNQEKIADTFISSLRIDDEQCELSEPDEIIKDVYHIAINFSNNSSTINSSYSKQLEEFVYTVNKSDKNFIAIQAGADKKEGDGKIDNQEYQIKLTDKRIAAFEKLLITHYGVNPKKFRSKENYGSSRPVALSEKEEDRQQNRRLHAFISND